MKLLEVYQVRRNETLKNNHIKNKKTMEKREFR